MSHYTYHLSNSVIDLICLSITSGKILTVSNVTIVVFNWSINLLYLVFIVLNVMFI